jgi:hypothetical protein
VLHFSEVLGTVSIAGIGSRGGYRKFNESGEDIH